MPVRRIPDGADADGSQWPVPQRAWYDFDRSDTVDQSGNGWTLTYASTPPIEVVDDRVTRALKGTSADYGTASTSLIGDSDHVVIWALIYYVQQIGTAVQLIGRGDDSSGAGWSLQLQINTAGALSAGSVAGTTYRGADSPTNALQPGWNFVALWIQQQFGVEPSHITSWANGIGHARTTLAGVSGMRGSGIGTYFGAAANRTTGNAPTRIAGCGVFDVNGITEAEAKIRLHLVEAHVRSLFEPQDLWVLVSAGGGTTLNATLIDAASTADIQSASVTVAGTLIDAAATADLQSTTTERSVTLLDAAAGTDIQSALATLSASLVDGAAGADINNSGAIANVSLVDGVLVVDVQSALATLAASLTDGVSATDLLTASRIANVVCTEAAATDDINSTGTTFARSIVETAVTAEALSAAAVMVASLVDAGGVQDQISAAQQLVVLLTESAAGSDLASGSQPITYSVTVVELAAAVDVLSAVMGGVTLAPSRRRVAMPDVTRLQRLVQMPAHAALRRSVAMYPA